MQTKIEKRSDCCSAGLRLVGGTIKNTVCSKCNYVCKTVEKKVRVPKTEKNPQVAKLKNIKISLHAMSIWQRLRFVAGRTSHRTPRQCAICNTPTKGNIWIGYRFPCKH